MLFHYKCQKNGQKNEFVPKCDETNFLTNESKKNKGYNDN